MLCAVDEAPDHNISVWDWQKGERGHKITETKVGTTLNKDKIYLQFYYNSYFNCKVKRLFIDLRVDSALMTRWWLLSSTQWTADT